MYWVGVLRARGSDTGSSSTLRKADRSRLCETPLAGQPPPNSTNSHVYCNLDMPEPGGLSMAIKSRILNTDVPLLLSI